MKRSNSLSKFALKSRREKGSARVLRSLKALLALNLRGELPDFKLRAQVVRDISYADPRWKIPTYE